MLAIEWKAFLGKGLRGCYLGCMAGLEAVKKGEMGCGFFYTGGIGLMGRMGRMADERGATVPPVDSAETAVKIAAAAQGE